MIKSNIYITTFLYILLVILLCFTEGNGIMMISIPLTLLYIGILLISKKCRYILIKSFKLKEAKWLCAFFIIAFLSGVVNIFTYHVTLPRFLLSITVTYLLSFAVYYFIGLLLPFLYSNKKIIKLFITSLLIIIFFGFIEFIIFSLHIYSFDTVFQFISGRITVLHYKMSTIPRIQSLFQEPSHYAWFLACSIPFVISIFKSNNIIYKNKYTNKIIKKSLLPLIIISLLLTRSPINIVIAIIVFILSLISIQKTSLKKMLLLTTVILILLFLISYLFLINEFLYVTVTKRIIAGVNIFSDFDSLIREEASLATRIVSYVNMFIVFLHHPILGTGCGSLSTEMFRQLQNSPLPLTPEMQIAISKTKAGGANPSIFFKLLVDVGLVGFVCWEMFMYNIYKKINKNLLYLYYDIRHFISGIQGSMIVFIILTIYDSTMTCHFYWCMFGVISGLYLKQLYLKRRFNIIFK